ncbi:MAG: class I SAM-dependent methyltransferase [Agrobacterium vaccinii]
MSGFDKNWLTLREPADRDARSGVLLETVTTYLGSHPPPHIIMDVGCGTGSTYRTLSPALPGAAWKLLDYEAALLDEAKRQIGDRNNIAFHCQDLNQLEETLFDGVALVTASALFDLCSVEFCSRFVELLSRRKVGIYAALNYDGIIEWSFEHPLDKQIVKDFNRHQRSDKGFGPALGPDASDRLTALCKARSFVVKTAKSPWQLGPETAELQKEFLSGFRQPIQEIGHLSISDFQEWLDFRLSNIGKEGSVCIVGHTDFLALPCA